MTKESRMLAVLGDATLSMPILKLRLEAIINESVQDDIPDVCISSRALLKTAATNREKLILIQAMKEVLIYGGHYLSAAQMRDAEKQYHAT